MLFRLEADFVFEADDLTDAQRRLGAHFLSSTLSGEGLSGKGELEERGPQGYIVLAPADLPQPDA